MHTIGDPRPDNAHVDVCFSRRERTAAGAILGKGEAKRAAKHPPKRYETHLLNVFV